MKYLPFIFLLFPLFFISNCKPKDGIHKIVHPEDHGRASDEIYIRFLSEQIDRYPEEKDNYIKLAHIYSNQGEVTKAKHLLQKAKEENVDNIDILLNLSALYLLEEDIQSLSSTLKKIREINPDNVEFLRLSAGYALLLRDYTNAIFFANRAMLANPYDDENYSLRGRAQLINRDSLSALISFEEAYMLKNSYKNFAEKFELVLALGDHGRAKVFIDEYLMKNPEQQLCYEWGAYYNEVGNRDTANLILTKCLSDKPEEPRVNYELAKIHYHEYNTDSTLLYLDRYLELDPRAIDGYVLKAKTMERINHFTEARNLYNTALEVDSTSLLASKGLDNLDRKVAYLRLVQRKEEVQKQVEKLKPLNSKELK